MKGSGAQSKTPPRRKRKARDRSPSPPTSLPSSTGLDPDDPIDADTDDDDFAPRGDQVRRPVQAAVAVSRTGIRTKRPSESSTHSSAADASRLSRTSSTASLFSTTKPFFVASNSRFAPELPSTTDARVQGTTTHVHTLATASGGGSDATGGVDAQSALWTDTASLAEEDLAVHKKKIDEVRRWLSHVFTAQDAGFRLPLPPPRILLLSGPPGCGKTAVLLSLAHSMDFDIVEWINPVRPSWTAPSEGWVPGRQQQSDYVPVMKEFRDFLQRCERYPTLALTAAMSTRPVHSAGATQRRKVVLVEDMPNIQSTPSQTRSFHDIVRSLAQCGRFPLVFIMSDSSDGDSRRLFPLDMPIARVSFNAVARTSLEKAMAGIASQKHAANPTSFMMPDKESLRRIAEAACGDIRAAVNALHFACVRRLDRRDESVAIPRASDLRPSKKAVASGAGGRGKGRAKAAGKKGAKADTGEKIGDADFASRDVSITLFHALGKILYAKRDVEGPTDTDSLPPSLSHCARHKLLMNPEDVIGRTAVSGETFTAFLQENYLDFLSDIDSSLLPCESFSEADVLSSAWKERDTLSTYASSIAARGLVFTGVHGQRGWRPLRKSRWIAINHRIRDARESLEQLFREGPDGAAPGSLHRHPTVDLHTEVIPFMRPIRPKMNEFQSRYLAAFWPYARDVRGPGFQELLEEEEAVVDEDTHADAPPDAPAGSTATTTTGTTGTTGGSTGTTACDVDDDDDDAFGGNDDMDDPALLAAALIADDELEAAAAAAESASNAPEGAGAKPYMADDDIEDC